MARMIVTLAQNGSKSQPIGAVMMCRDISVSFTTPSSANIDLNNTE